MCRTFENYKTLLRENKKDFNKWTYNIHGLVYFILLIYYFFPDWSIVLSESQSTFQKAYLMEVAILF